MKDTATLVASLPVEQEEPDVESASHDESGNFDIRDTIDHPMLH